MITNFGTKHRCYYVPLEDQIIDILIKALGRVKFETCRHEINLRNLQNIL